MEASVRIFVVSWKDAAASQLLVLSAALVMPSRTGCAVAGSPPSASHFSIDVLILEAVRQFAGNQLGVPGRISAHFGQHLAYNGLDMLIVDRHTL